MLLAFQSTGAGFSTPISQLATTEWTQANEQDGVNERSSQSNAGRQELFILFKRHNNVLTLFPELIHSRPVRHFFSDQGRVWASGQ
jgi:hypothetical protein